MKKFDIDLDRWPRFFREGKDLDDASLPNYMLTQEMKQAMTILKQFSEKERAYDRYRARINYLRDQITMEEEKEAVIAEKEAAEADKKAAEAELKEAKKYISEKEHELEILRAQLAQKNNNKLD